MRKSYKGILAEPLPAKPTPGGFGEIGLLQDPPGTDKRIRAWLLEKKKRVAALADEFSIPRKTDNFWFLLAMALAERHVPGFKPARPKHTKGRPPSRDTFAGAEERRLFLEIVRKIQAGNEAITDAAAVKLILKNKKHKASLPLRMQKLKAESLRKEIQKAKREADAIANAFAVDIRPPGQK